MVVKEILEVEYYGRGCSHFTKSRFGLHRDEKRLWVFLPDRLTNKSVHERGIHHNTLGSVQVQDRGHLGNQARTIRPSRPVPTRHTVGGGVRSNELPPLSPQGVLSRTLSVFRSFLYRALVLPRPTRGVVPDGFRCLGTFRPIQGHEYNGKL